MITVAGSVIAALASLVWFVQLAMTARFALRRSPTAVVDGSDRISILVALDGSTADAVTAVHRALRAGHREIEVVAVIDGAAGDTFAALVDAFELEDVHPIYQRVLQTQDIRSIHRSSQDRRLVVVEKLAGGRLDALNAALNVSSGTRVLPLEDGVELDEFGLRSLDMACSAADAAAVIGPLRPSKRRRPWAWVLDQLIWRAAGGSLQPTDGATLINRDALISAGGFATPLDRTGSGLLVRLGMTGTRLRTVGTVWAVEEPVGSRSGSSRSDRHVGLASVGARDVGGPVRRASVVVSVLGRWAVEALAAVALVGLLVLLVTGSASLLLTVGAALLVRASTLVLAAIVADRSSRAPRSIFARGSDVILALRG